MNQNMPDSKEGAEFLRADFSENFRQMCYYDGQIIDVCKFAFFGYSGVLGFAIGLYKFGVEKNVDLSLSAFAIVCVGLIVGLLVFSLVIRNRVYFVISTRYINELRDHFLKGKPLDFENKTGMYTNWRKPPYFDFLSSQLLVSYLIAFFNATLLGVLLYLVKLTYCLASVIGILLFLLQIILGICYLMSREGMQAEGAVFGKTNSE